MVWCLVPGCGMVGSWELIREVGRMAVKGAHPSVEERKAQGREARELTPAPSHAGWRPATDRADPVGLLDEQNRTREPDLVPVRHGRMMVSPFTFYRGAAKIMAADLDGTPTAGLVVQLCGDAHLSNFGVFGSPERRLLFDLNDFDETLPGPFEYDVKRMAASFTIAARNNGFSTADARASTLASLTAYREAMAGFAGMGTLDIWYAHLAEDELMGLIRSTVAGMEKQAKAKKRGKRAKKDRRARQRERRQRPRDGRRRPRRRIARRPARGTACRHCPSWASWSTGGIGSPASRRSSSRPATWPPPTACPQDEVEPRPPRAVTRVPEHPAA